MSRPQAQPGHAPTALSTSSGGRSEGAGVPRRGLRSLGKVGWNLLPAVSLIALVLIWGIAVAAFRVPDYILPGPIAVFTRIGTDFPLLWSNTVVTLTEVGIGFGLTIVISIPLGLAIALSRWLKQLVYAPLTLLQLVPKIAVAPLFLVWLGFGIESKIVLTVLLTFFPLLLASIAGFQILDDRLLYLTRSMGANGRQTFWYLRFPAALPVIFSGIKTSAAFAVVGAVVAEFVGANAGLGYLLLKASSTLDTTLIFAAIVVLTIIGVALNYVIEFVEWLLSPSARAK